MTGQKRREKLRKKAGTGAEGWIVVRGGLTGAYKTVPEEVEKTSEE